jgi:phosphatidylserine decarboxylase
MYDQLVTRTGWDMDPFVVISFGKRVVRTRVIRHSRDPVWNEKMLFHVQRYETKFNLQFTVLDWDKLSSNDLIGEALFNVQELSGTVPQKDDKTGLYPPEGDGVGEMKEFVLPLTTAKEMPWESKHNPTITIK